jgi:hypothetical protein
LGLSGETITLTIVVMSSGPKIGVVLAPKGLDFFQPFLRGFVTANCLLSEVEKEGFFSCHLPRPEAVLDRNHTIEDPGVGQAFAPLRLGRPFGLPLTPTG